MFLNTLRRTKQLWDKGVKVSAWRGLEGRPDKKSHYHRIHLVCPDLSGFPQSDAPSFTCIRKSKSPKIFPHFFVLV